MKNSTKIENSFVNIFVRFKFSKNVFNPKYGSSLKLVFLFYLFGVVMAENGDAEIQKISVQDVNDEVMNSSNFFQILLRQRFKREISEAIAEMDGPENVTKSTNVSMKAYEVVNFEFHRVETPFIIGVWIFFASLAKIGFHMVPKLNQSMPESCLLIAVGVAIGLVLLMFNSIHVSPLTPDTFFLYMLPPIILDAGYFMPNRLFFDNLGTIIMFAVVGTVFNTLTIGASLWALGLTDAFGCDTPVLEIFLFSSLISAVDPVAVLAVFEEIHVNEVLYIVVFGESLLNDAVTVVLYHMFEVYNEMGFENIKYSDILAGFASFFVISLGGVVIGVIWGFLTALVTRYTTHVRVMEPLIVFVIAYIAYLNAEMFHMSGILAITFCGITMKNYVEANISHKSHTTVKYTMKMLSSSSETIIFMFLGVATVNEKHDWNTNFVISTLVFCTVYRTLGVIILTSIVNHFRLVKLNRVDEFVMSYGGLRGAVAFALALLINGTVRRKSMFITTTIAVIYFTVFVQGISIRPLVEILNVKKAERRKPTMNERIHERFMDHLMAGIEDVVGHHGNHHIRDKFKRFDNTFIRPFLVRYHQGAEPKIFETYSKLAMKDALEFMRRNASTMGMSQNGSVTGISRNCTTANLNANTRGSRSTTGVDAKEHVYHPNKRDMTEAKVHHLLSTKLRQPPKRQRRLSYSRHSMDERDLSTQVNYRTHVNTRRIVGGEHHRSKKNKDGVSLPIRVSGTAKQFLTDAYYEENTDEDFYDYKNDSDDYENGITFTARPSTPEVFPHYANAPLNFLDWSKFRDSSSESCSMYSPNKKKSLTPTAAEVSLPWRRNANDMEDIPLNPENPTSGEKKLPWKRSEEEAEAEIEALKQREFPKWSINKDYMTYNSPSTTFLGKIEKRKIPSVIGFFRRSSKPVPLESQESLSSPSTGSTVARNSTGSTTNTSVCYLSPYTDSSNRQYTPLRRGSMMELTSSVNPIPEEELLTVAIKNASGKHRWRSSSMCVPRRSYSISSRKASSYSISSSSSTSSDDDENCAFE